MIPGDELERDAIALVKQYRFLLPAAVKILLLKIANRMDWHTLKEELK